MEFSDVGAVAPLLHCAALHQYNNPEIPPMNERKTPSAGASPGRLILIAVVVAGVAGAFAYTAGWLSPQRVTPAKVVDILAPPGGPVAGYRRNHAKGICFTGTFEANGAGVALSKALLFAAGSHPVTGRFNLAVPTPTADDGTARVRGLSLRVRTADGQEWRSAMISAPFFPVATTQAFYDLAFWNAQVLTDIHLKTLTL